MYRKFGKRCLDFVLALIAIILLSPIYLIIAILVRIKMGSPVLFSQERIGKDEKIFRLYKFRSMTNEKGPDGKLLPEKERVNRFGAVLRSTSLDELPELWLILTGKMSFVGPRPLPTYYNPYFFESERKRHSVRGGLIPPDSLSGKTYTTFEEQFHYECEYADHITFSLDVKIILTTIKILFNRVETQYGAELDRPHLNVQRAYMNKEKVNK